MPQYFTTGSPVLSCSRSLTVVEDKNLTLRVALFEGVQQFSQPKNAQKSSKKAFNDKPSYKLITSRTTII